MSAKDQKKPSPAMTRKAIAETFERFAKTMPEAATELHTSALALQKQRDLDEKEAVADDSVTRIANILRNTDDIDQWNRVAAKYMEETGRDMEATKKAFPPPAQKLNRGGLMARQ